MNFSVENIEWIPTQNRGEEYIGKYSETPNGPKKLTKNTIKPRDIWAEIWWNWEGL